VHFAFFSHRMLANNVCTIAERFFGIVSPMQIKPNFMAAAENYCRIYKYYKSFFCTVSNFSSSALTLLVGQQEGHPACKTTRCCFVGGDDLTGALHDL